MAFRRMLKYFLNGCLHFVWLPLSYSIDKGVTYIEVCNMERKTKQFVIYSRKSKFTGKGESIENQIEMCRQYITAHYGGEAAAAALVYEDEGFSGGNLERPEFKKMMSDAQKIAFAAIVVYRLDRISRNIGDFAKLVEELGNRHIEFISIREQFDTSSPMGRAMMYIASVFSQLERETIAERIRDNMHELAKTGRWLGGNTPTGYESESIAHVTVDGKTRKACRLKIIPDELHLVKLIFDKFTETGSLAKTDEFLTSGHYKTKRGKAFTRFAIKAILSNPVYMIADEDAYNYLVENGVDLFAEKEAFDGKCGIMAYNRTLQRQGKTTREKPINEWIVSLGKHQGAISGAAWVQAQRLLEQNKSKSYRKSRGGIALLSGLVVCGNCGSYMRAKLTDRKTKTGEPIYTYLCTAKERSKGHACDIKNANGNTLDKEIMAVIKSLGRQSATMASQITRAKKRIGSSRAGYEAESYKIKLQIVENEKDLKALVFSLGKVEGTHAEKYIIEQIDELHKKGEGLKMRLSELEAIIGERALSEMEFDTICQTLADMGACFEEYTLEGKRTAIRALIRKIVWDGENAHVYLFESGDDYPIPVPPHENSADLCKPSGEDSK